MPGEPRGMWCSNQTCEARIQARKWAIHQQRLREMRPSIDAKDPRRPKKHDGRKARLEEERNQQIMHENTILLNKLSKILTRESNGQDGKLPTLGPGGSAGGASASLHDIHRRKVREQIDRENRQLLTRLQTMKPSIDIIAFEEQYQQHLLHQQAGKFIGNPMLQSNAAAPPRRRARAAGAAARARPNPASGGTSCQKSTCSRSTSPRSPARDARRADDGGAGGRERRRGRVRRRRREPVMGSRGAGRSVVERDS